MAGTDDFYVVTVEDTVIQVTCYVVRATGLNNASALVAQGIYAFASEAETVDTISSQIKSVEGIK
jgi:hypothetical protein